MQWIATEYIEPALQALIQGLQCMMEPPATGTPNRALLIIEDINRDYLTRLAGGDQRWIIRQAKVLPEP